MRLHLWQFPADTNIKRLHSSQHKAKFGASPKANFTMYKALTFGQFWVNTNEIIGI